MELGNLVFGHSRGEFEVPRGRLGTDSWEDALFELFEALRPEGDVLGLDPYGPAFENDVFVVRPYYCGDCECGYDYREALWCAANTHQQGCYQDRYEAAMAEYDQTSGYAAVNEAAFGPDDDLASLLMGGFDTTVEQVAPGIVASISTPRTDAAMEAWRHAHEKRSKHVEAVRRQLCAEFGLPFPAGSYGHCTCDYNHRWRLFVESDSHDPTCRVVAPNFYYKPADFQLRWYKYPLRDSYMNQDVGLKEFKRIIGACIESLCRQRT